MELTLCLTRQMNGCVNQYQLWLLSVWYPGWMDGWTNKPQVRISEELLSFVSLLSLGTWCTSWKVESWMLLLCWRFKAGCCCPLGTCLASDTSLLGVTLKQQGHVRLQVVIACTCIAPFNEKQQSHKFTIKRNTQPNQSSGATEKSTAESKSAASAKVQKGHFKLRCLKPVSPSIWDPVHAFWAAADLTGTSPFATSLSHLPLPLTVPLPPPGASAGRAPLHMLPGWNLRQRTLHKGFMVVQSRCSFIGGGGSSSGTGLCSACARACARAHRLRDDLELVGSRAVVVLLVLDAAVVLEEELAGLLEHTAALTDGTVGHRTWNVQRNYFLISGGNWMWTLTGQELQSYSLLRVLLKK